MRELENLLERICLLEEGDCIRPDHLPARILRDVARPTGALDDPAALPVAFNGHGASEPAQDYHVATARFQRALIEQTLASCRQNFGSTAERLGLSRHALRHQMMKLGLLAPPAGSGEEGA